MGWVLGVGCWVLGVGCWVLGVGYWVLGKSNSTPVDHANHSHFHHASFSSSSADYGSRTTLCRVLGVGCWVVQCKSENCSPTLQKTAHQLSENCSPTVQQTHGAMSVRKLCKHSAFFIVLLLKSCCPQVIGKRKHQGVGC